MSFLLAHLSDAHIGPLPKVRKRELIGKRLTGYVNWRRRGRLHDMDVLRRIVDDMRGRVPDHIAMTGDILNIGLKAEFPIARVWLETLGTIDDVSFVPGNHDAYVRSSMRHLSETFAPWVKEIGVVDGLPFTFPYLRRRGPLALIGLSSAIPTAPLLASGALGAAQCAALGPLLDAARAEGLVRVVMIHHPPHATGAKGGRGLRDAARFEAVIAHHGAELVLHGHNHRASIHRMPGPEATTVPVVGVPSCSAVSGLARPSRGLPPLPLRAPGRGTLRDRSLAARRRRARRAGLRSRALRTVEAQRRAAFCCFAPSSSSRTGAWFSSATSEVPPTTLPRNVGAKKRVR